MNTYQINLQFFAAEGEGRTEKATPKKREDARKKGQVAKSMELNTAFILMTFFGMMMILGSYYLSKSIGNIEKVFIQIPEMIINYDSQKLLLLIAKSIMEIIILSGPLWAGLFIVGLLISLVQVGYHPTLKTLTPKFNKMNPIKGIKKIVSKDVLVELLKSIGKVIFLGAILMNIIQKEIPTFLKFYDMTTKQILLNMGDVIVKIGLNVGGAFLFLAILDYAYQKYKFEDSIKMSKQEIKDEYKQSEGDPQVKGKIRQKMREMSLKRMMQAIPDADVIITNPTHFAVAISYNPETGSAPIVVAKGVDHIAQKIKEKAKEHQVEIVENRLLARTLYYTVEINAQIPPELYNAVAEVLAFVYSLQNKINRRK
ncbi:MAG: flagellar biosynthesis protein FlhB [Cellulosilyticaceae bacterium]